MQLGACHACGTPYTSQDVAGLGILRARPAAAGGPRIEYRCSGCGAVLVLVPHGEGRYAPPGASPPAHVPHEARRPAWSASPPREAGTGPEPRAGADRDTPPQGNDGHGEPGALGLVAAYELLGVPVTADRETIEKAFRARSLACHPDKVAHLDEDFRVLAEQKFKRLVEAFRLVNGVLPG